MRFDLSAFSGRDRIAAGSDPPMVAATRPLPAVGLVTFLVGLACLLVGAGGAIFELRNALVNDTLILPQLLLVLPLAAWGYSLRFVRWHLLIRRAVPTLGLWQSFRAQAIGFGLSVTPGRVGELWKLHLVERATNAPAALGGGAMLIERATDLIGFTVLVLLAATQATGTVAYHPGLSALAVAVALAILLVTRPYLTRRLSAARGPTFFRHLVEGGDAVIRPVPVALAFLSLVVGRAGDGLLLWGTLAALGHPIAPAYAILAFAVGGLVGGISLLPGGLGAAEGTMVGLLTLSGVPIPVGLAAALITRGLILWVWVALGILLFAHDQFGRQSRQHP